MSLLCLFYLPECFSISSISVWFDTWHFILSRVHPFFLPTVAPAALSCLLLSTSQQQKKEKELDLNDMPPIFTCFIATVNSGDFIGVTQFGRELGRPIWGCGPIHCQLLPYNIQLLHPFSLSYCIAKVSIIMFGAAVGWLNNAMQ